MAPRVINLDTR